MINDHGSNPPKAQVSQEPLGETNPFASPTAAGVDYPIPIRRDVLPRYCKTMAVLDIVWCALRLPLIAFGLFGTFVPELKGMSSVRLPTTTEIVAGMFVIALGFAAAASMLRMNRRAVLLGVLALIATCASIMIERWHTSDELDRLSALGQEPTTYDLASMGMFFIRSALVAYYGGALSQYSNWYKELERIRRYEQIVQSGR